MLILPVLEYSCYICTPIYIGAGKLGGYVRFNESRIMISSRLIQDRRYSRGASAVFQGQLDSRSPFYLSMVAQARGAVLYIRGCFSFCLSFHKSTTLTLAASSEEAPYSKKPFAFLRQAFTIEVTSLPYALHCCCTVLELNLQDRPKHQILPSLYTLEYWI